MDSIIIEPVLRAERIELVCHREGDVTPGVTEELGQLRLERLEPHDFVAEEAEERRGPLASPRAGSRDDLRQVPDLLDRESLGHPLRAESEIDPGNVLVEPAREEIGGAGIDGGAQDEELLRPEMCLEAADDREQRIEPRVQVLVDPGADHANHDLRVADPTRVGGRFEVLADVEAEQFLRAALHESDLAASYSFHRRGVDIDDGYLAAFGGEHASEGESHVAAPPEHGNAVVPSELLFHSVSHCPATPARGMKRVRPGSISVADAFRSVPGSWIGAPA